MDGLFTILILFGVFALTSSNKKKKAQRQAEKQRAFRESAEAVQQEKIPFSKDEWADFLRRQANPSAPKPRPEPAPKPVQAAPKPAAKPAPEAKTAKLPERKPLHLQHDEPEGTVSTQGESAAEHAEHRRKVLAEEAKRREEHQAMEDLRAMNLQKLRTAVVMSEILDKPVSLRRRGSR